MTTEKTRAEEHYGRVSTALAHRQFEWECRFADGDITPELLRAYLDIEKVQDIIAEEIVRVATRAKRRRGK